jgi:BASS family bile acid:Na+ symporter
MAPPDTSTAGASAGLVRAANWLHRYFLLAIVGVYVLAGLLPGPGSTIREFAIAVPGVGKERVSMLLLAVLLFCAAAVIEWVQVRDILERPSVLLAALFYVWLGPALLVVVFGPILELAGAKETTAGMMVGFALVAAMPVANSSAGWTQNAGGNVALSLSLIVLSILLSPLVTPSLLKLLGWTLSAGDVARIETVVTQFSGWKFILWVILPSLAGAGAAWSAGHRRIVRAKPWFRLVTMTMILLLNYANASLAIDKIWNGESAGVVALAAVMAVAVSVVGLALAGLQARAFRLSRRSWLALAFGLSMKHTGLALVLAGEILRDQPRVILVVLLTTLAQHVAAAAIDRREQSVRTRHAAD